MSPSPGPGSAVLPRGRWNAGRLLRVAGTLLLGGHLATRIELAAVSQILAGAAAGWLAAAVALYALDRIAAGVKWRMLFNTAGHPISTPLAVSLYLRSSFLGAALPATVGTDLIRAHLAGRGRSDFTHALGSVVVERFLGVIALLLAALLGVASFAPQAARAVAAPMIAVAGATAVGAVLLVRAAPARTGVPAGGLRSRVSGFLLDLFRRLRAYATRPRALALALLLAFGQQYLLTVINWGLGRALGLDLGLGTMLWVWPIVMIAIRMPLSILGFGVREVALVQLLAEAGLAPEQAVALGLLSGLLDLAFIGVGGLLVLAGPGGARPLPSSARP